MEHVMWDASLIRAQRFDADRFATILEGQKPAEFALFRECWKVMPTSDLRPPTSDFLPPISYLPSCTS